MTTNTAMSCPRSRVDGWHGDGDGAPLPPPPNKQDNIYKHILYINQVPGIQ